MKFLGFKFGRDAQPAPGDSGAPAVGVSPAGQGLADPNLPPAAPGNEGRVLMPFVEKQPPIENPPVTQAIYLNPRWEPINISQNTTAIGIQTAIREAENGETRELFRYYRDAILSDDHIQGCLNARKLALLSTPMVVLPEDKNNPDDVAAAKACKRASEDCENWIDAMSNFMGAIFWPVVVQERLYRVADAPRPGEPKLRFTLRKFTDVNKMLFCFRWSYLTGGIAMGTASPLQQAGLGLTPGNFMVDLEVFEPFFKLWPIDNSGRIIYDAASAQYLDRTRHIVHRGHLLTEHLDNWGGPGRAILAWWLLRQLGRDWFANLIQTYGKPFMLGKTNVEDQQAIDFLKQAIERARRLGGIVIGHEDELELVESMVSGAADAHTSFEECCNSAIARFICGQDIERGGNKLDGGADAKLKGSVRADVRMFDQTRMGETITKKIFTPFLELNGLPGRCKASWGGMSPEQIAALGGLLVNLKQAGLQPTDEAIDTISDNVGFPVERVAVPDPVDDTLPDPAGRTPDDDDETPGRRAKKGLRAGAPEGTGAAQLRSLGINDITARNTDLSRRSPAKRDEGGSPPPSDAIALRKADALAAAYRGALAPVAEIIMSSNSPEECQVNLAKFFRDWSNARVRAVTEEALQLCAAAALDGKATERSESR